MQRDKKTYAIAPHIPGGIIIDFNLPRRVADVAEKYSVKTVKLTSVQRFALVGLKLEDLDPVWQELGLVHGAAIGLCVRSIKICPGTTFYRIAQQDAVGVGLHLDEKYHGMPLPFKFKIGVLGCPNNTTVLNGRLRSLTMGGALPAAVTFSRQKVRYRKISLPAISFSHMTVTKEAHESRILSSRLE